MTEQKNRDEMLDLDFAQRLGIAMDENSLGIVSVWADRSGRALVWQREGSRVRCSEERFRPWIFAATLEHMEHVGAALVAETTAAGDSAPFRYRELDGPSGSYRYLLSARDGRALERTIITGAARQLGRAVK